MSTANLASEQRVLLSGITWATYEAILAESKDHGTRFTYDRGYLEMMSPSREHERFKRFIGRMIEAMTEELGIPISSAGATTLKAEWQERGLEADESYYIANESRVRGAGKGDRSNLCEAPEGPFRQIGPIPFFSPGRDELDLRTDPPPDLAIEVDISSSSLDQLSIYAVLGVPEVWIFDGESLEVHQLQANGIYVRQPHSPAFPFLPLDEVERFLARRNETDETTWVRSVREWVRTLTREG